MSNAVSSLLYFFFFLGGLMLAVSVLCPCLFSAHLTWDLSSEGDSACSSSVSYVFAPRPQKRGLLDIPTVDRPSNVIPKPTDIFRIFVLSRNMCSKIADNLNVHSFSLKLVIFFKAILEQNWPFKGNLLCLNKG